MLERKARLIDSQFADFLSRRSLLPVSKQEQFRDLLCRLSMGLAAGDSCLPVTPVEMDLCAGSGLAGVGAYPLCVSGNRLYLQRYFEHEQSLARNICGLLSNTMELSVDAALFDKLFGSDNGETDWQRVAAKSALQQRFLIVSGGPGTGKTTTVVKILALLQSAAESPLRIALAAPTGKAAKRLQDSINDSVRELSVTGSIKESIPKTASTLHRLLGVRRHSPFFRHNAERPLLFDLVVVDEASMVDLALMDKLVSALRAGSSLILLGDKDQLASVESGTVLADMTQSLPGNTVELLKSYRFDTGIKDFSQAINNGDSGSAWNILVNDTPVNVSLLDENVIEYAGEIYRTYMEEVRAAASLEDYRDLFQTLHTFKILCALRHGKSGVYGVNRAVETYLTQKGYDCFGTDWYPGRPVIMTRNEYSLGLYNGDMGICMVDPENRDCMKVWFEGTDGTLSGILPGRISSCETVYALTIHKSQGTEMNEVLVLLPEQESALISRELLYTAVTRAKKRVWLSTSRTVFDSAVAGRIERNSGLVESLSGKDLVAQ